MAKSNAVITLYPNGTNNAPDGHEYCDALYFLLGNERVLFTFDRQGLPIHVEGIVTNERVRYEEGNRVKDISVQRLTKKGQIKKSIAGLKKNSDVKRLFDAWGIEELSPEDVDFNPQYPR